MQMHDQFPRWAARVAMILLLAALTACAPRPEPDRHPAVETAEDALSQGDFDTAVSSFLEAAEAEESPLREEYTLMAAAALVDSGDTGRGERLATNVEVTEDTPTAIIDFRNAVLARAALADGDYERSLELVAERLPSETGRAADLVEVRADAQYQIGRLLESAETRSSLEELLPPGDRLDRNRERLQETLAEVPMRRLREVMPPAPDIYGGWLELTFLIRNYRLDPSRMEEAVELWRERFPDHPAADTIADDIMARYREEVLRPEQVDLLLPLSGSLADSGRAVRDGFLAARLQHGNEGPDVRIHDIGEDGDDPWAAYMNAVQSGSDLVIGPLTRPAVSVFAETSSLPVPMLALNSAGDRDELPGNLFSFGLLPEHEARQAARHALSGGQRHAVVLVPSNDWGRRVADAFADEFEENGGSVLARERYESDRTDFSLPIRRMLALDQSGQRQRQLQSTIGRSVEFEPRRRMDVDVIFVGAFPRQARLIRPQLRFHHALDLPVMTTSHAWGGRDDVASDRDMAGVVFFDMPWMLGEGDRVPPTRTSLATAWDERVKQHAPLYALGADAYRLIPYLATMRTNEGERLEGATGLLRIRESGEVQREVMPARFHRGRVERLQLEEDAPRLPGLDAVGDVDASGETGAPAEADGIDARNGLDELEDFDE